jgi:hypothetical protein
MSADSRLVLRSYIKLLHAGSQIARENFSRLSTTSLEQNVYPKDHSEDLSYFPLVYCRSFLGLKKNIVNISRPLLHDRLQTCNDFSSTALQFFLAASPGAPDAVSLRRFFTVPCPIRPVVIFPIESSETDIYAHIAHFNGRSFGQIMKMRMVISWHDVTGSFGRVASLAARKNRLLVILDVIPPIIDLVLRIGVEFFRANVRKLLKNRQERRKENLICANRFPRDRALPVFSFVCSVFYAFLFLFS